MFIYVIPYQDKYIIYRPLKKLAFLANAALVNLIVQAQEDLQKCLPIEENNDALQFLESVSFWEPELAPAPSALIREFI